MFHSGRAEALDPSTRNIMVRVDSSLSTHELELIVAPHAYLMSVQLDHYECALCMLDDVGAGARHVVLLCQKRIRKLTRSKPGRTHARDTTPLPPKYPLDCDSHACRSRVRHCKVVVTTCHFCESRSRLAQPVRKESCGCSH